MPIAKHAGRSTRRFKALSLRTKRDWKAKNLPCCECHTPIDWTLDHNDRMAPTTAHHRSVATHPELAEDPANIKGIAHRVCNSKAGTGEGLGDRGTTSHDW